ncbi:MAG TPA: amino acid adenylation domain-containing protein [Polyangiaceae bacterium]|nr:amino acid adenylation domain-containing protein [Polyangiaceae bacterium]
MSTEPVENLARAFFDTALAHPDRPALVLPGRTLTYAELAREVRRLRAALATEPPGSRIGVFASRSLGAYAGVLAVLASGSAYVPENPAFPAERNRYVVEKAGLSTLVVSDECAAEIVALLRATSGHFRLVALEPTPALEGALAEFAHRVRLDVAGDAEDPSIAEVDSETAAYVLFTSGSTGNPKGVVVRHRNVRRYIRSVLALDAVFPEDRVSQTFDLTFDLSVHDLFTAWSSGAALVVYSNAALGSPIPFSREERVTVWFSVPSLAAFLESSRLLEEGGLPDLRLSFFCGEKLTFNTVALWRRIAPRTKIVNLYGPTETTIAVTRFEVPPDFPESESLHGGIPIGDPLPGQKLEIRREDGSLAPLGEAGSLFLSGDQVTAGYLGEPELTRSRFAEDGERVWYRTGDLVLRDARGHVQFLGREDFQVKIMGYRVELGEIEHALMKASGAAQAVADVAVIRNGMEELYAVLPKALRPEKKRIREALKLALPPYMLPRHYVFSDELPLNANGKVDRRALKARVVAALADE